MKHVHDPHLAAAWALAVVGRAGVLRERRTAMQATWPGRRCAREVRCSVDEVPTAGHVRGGGTSARARRHFACAETKTRVGGSGFLRALCRRACQLVALLHPPSTKDGKTRGVACTHTQPCRQHGNDCDEPEQAVLVSRRLHAVAWPHRGGYPSRVRLRRCASDGDSREGDRHGGREHRCGLILRRECTRAPSAPARCRVVSSRQRACTLASRCSRCSRAGVRTRVNTWVRRERGCRCGCVGVGRHRPSMSGRPSAPSMESTNTR